MTAIKSQLSAMSGVTPPTTQPQSQLARYVAADIKGGDVAHAFRMSIISTAILESFKGNYRNVLEAISLTEGKAKKARAYKAAFEAVGVIDKLAYAGKWDAATNKGVREQAHTLTEKLVAQFEVAFAAVMDEKAAPKEAKPSAKERAEAAEADAAAARAELAAERAKATPMTVEADRAVVDIGQAVEAVAQALQQGLLDSTELEILRVALALVDNASDTAGTPLLPSEIANMGADNPLLQAQAA